jgi:thioredoxin reductase
MCRTSVPGLWAAGDAAAKVPPSITSATADGYLAGAGIVIDIAAGW